MVHDGDDDLSGFLLGMATSRAALGGSWVLDFYHWWYSPSRESPTCLHLVTFYDMQEKTTVQFYSPRNRRGAFLILKNF